MNPLKSCIASCPSPYLLQTKAPYTINVSINLHLNVLVFRNLTNMEIFNMLSTLSWFSLSMFCGIIGVNSPQVYRPFILFFLVCFALLAFRNVSDQKLGFEGTETLAIFCVIYISHITCVLCVE